jgi:hypothetical protein
MEPPDGKRITKAWSLPPVAALVRTRQAFPGLQVGRPFADVSRALTSAATGVGLAVLLALCAPASAQPLLRIGYVYPAGGRQGATFQVVVGGQYLEGVTNVYVSGAGGQGVVVDFHKPMPPGQFNLLRDRLRELQDKKRAAARDSGRSRRSTNVWTAADEKLMTEIREKMLKNPPNRNATPAIAEIATLRVTLATNAPPGAREIRLGTPTGLSNPLAFHVGQLPEFSDPPAKAPNPDADRFRERFGRQSKPDKPKTESRVTIPAVVNGQILPGEVDRFRFAARQGQRLVVEVSARALIPYLPDAVPGWFQATLALLDAQGKELAYRDDFRFQPDPVLYYEIPRDGDYVIEIKDAIYRGREDFVYRIALGERPFVTSVFPLGGPAGALPSVEVKGWNLPVKTLTPDFKDREPGLQLLSVPMDGLPANPVPFAVDTLPESREQEPNNLPSAAQSVTLPVIVNGHIETAGDVDVFRFEGAAGDAFVAEVSARRLGSPLDAVLRLTDASGKVLAANDDFEDKASGLNTHHADSFLSFTLPATGAYYVHLGDTQRQGGAEYGYRLRLSPPRPDFELRVVPSTVNVRAGAHVPLTVYALRKDGFTGDIALALEDAPPGFALTGARVPAGQDQVRLTLAAPSFPSREPFRLRLTGRAAIQGRTVTRPAVPAEDMMQAFAYRHLVPARELQVAVWGRTLFRAVPQVRSATPVRIPAGGTARVRLGLPPGRLGDRLHLELSDPPAGITLKDVSAAGSDSELVLAGDPAAVKPGLKGNLIVTAFMERMSEAGGDKARVNRRRAPVGTLPAIPFEVVARP